MNRSEKIKLRIKHCATKSEQRFVCELIDMPIAVLKETEMKHSIITKETPSLNNWNLRRQLFAAMELNSRGYKRVAVWKKN